MAVPTWYKTRVQDDEEEKDQPAPPVQIPIETNPSSSGTTVKGAASNIGAAFLNQSQPDTIDTEEVSADAPSWYGNKVKSGGSESSGGGSGGDYPSWYQNKVEEEDADPSNPAVKAFKDFMGGEKATAGNVAIQAAKAGGMYLLDKALSGKSIPKGVFDDASFGIGKLQGWCGVYAGRISTAENVGDYWSQKRTHIDKQKGIKAGDKILIPLGVKWVGGKPQGYGHVMVAITDENASGDFAVAQSNADGRQNRGEGPGIASYGAYNSNELTKRYKSEWGAVNGKLKVNVWNKGVAQQMSQSIATKAPSANASATQLAQFVIDNGITDLKGEDWWNKAKNKKEAWSIIQNTQGEDTNEEARVNTAGGRSALQILGGIALKVGTNKAVDFLSRLKGPSNDQAPPDIDKADYSAEALAKYVVENEVGDLGNKKWWINSPQKAEAWKLINKMKGRAEYFTEGATISQGEIKTTDKKAVDAMTESILGIIDPNNYFSPGLTDNQVAKRADVKSNVNEAAKLTQARINEVQSENENNWWINNPVGNAIYGSVNATAEGVKQLSGGETGNDTNVVAGLKNTAFGILGLVSPGVASFNVTTQLPGIKPVAEATFEKWQGVKDWVKTLPVVEGLNRDGKELLDLGMDIGLFSLIHKGSKQLKEVATNKNVKYSAAEVKDALSEITIGKDGKATPLKTELKRILDGAKEGAEQKQMLKDSYKNGITVKEARSFTKWFNNFFSPLTKKGIIEPNLKPEFQKLLTDGKKAGKGDISQVEFTKQAREVLAKGESATLRDSLPGSKNMSVDMALYDKAPGVGGKNIIDKVVEGQSRLNDLHEKGKTSVVSVEAGKQQALNIDTYTYSDGKVGVGFSLSTEVAEIQAPISGKFSSPREAVKEIMPIIEEAVSKGSDLASEAVRTEIDKLKETKFSKVPNKGEISPWEENGSTLTDVPTKAVEIKNMSKQAIEAEIKSTLDDYIKTALKNGKGQGVIATQHGRKTNNDNWYVKLYRENGGRRPTQQQIREVAMEHLTNGVTDRSIGEMPPNKRFQQLVQKLPTARPDRALKTPGEPAQIPERVAEFKSTISTPESRVSGEQAPIISDGKTATSQQRLAEGQKASEYKKVKTTEQLAKAEKFVTENPELAKKIMRNQDSVPEDLDRGSVLAALRDKAADMGDAKLEAEAQTALTKFKTRTAQDLALLKGDMNTTDYFVRKLLEAKTEAKSSFSIEEKSKSDYLTTEVEQLRKQIKEGMLADESGKVPKGPRQRRERSIKEAQKILDLMTCS